MAVVQGVDLLEVIVDGGKSCRDPRRPGWSSCSDSSCDLVHCYQPSLARVAARLLVERAVETLLLVAVAEFASRLGREGEPTGDLWSAGSSGELQQSCRAQDYSDLLYAAFHQTAQLFLVLGADFYTERCSSHIYRMPLKPSALGKSYPSLLSKNDPAMLM